MTTTAHLTPLNDTHDPTLTSWLASAQAPGCDFPIQNLPHGVFRRKGKSEAWRGGVAIGDQVLDMAAASGAGVFSGPAARAAQAAGGASLNALMALGAPAWRALRQALSEVLRTGSPHEAALRGCLVAQDDCEFTLPARIGDYTDFYTSIYHATNVGKLFRPDNPLMPNYKWVPIGYHGRASTVVVSGQDFRRPQGQTLPPGASEPRFGPCQRLDYELELGIWMGSGNAMGEPIALADAEHHVFGLTLLNDWSARDIQAWEYQPLGPFLSKNFATTVSPWIVTLEALAPYRLPYQRPAGDPAPLPYLEDAVNRAQGSLDIQLEVQLTTPQMQARGDAPAVLARTSYRHAYWTLAQLVAHHTVGGCAMQPGDLLGTGTLSGPTATEAGALLELTVGGKQPVALPGGETRTFLQDGDTVGLAAWCERPGAARIGFGPCTGTILAALS
ncbi:MAG: fumarylacetoacetase [Proteobacteria bacterium]|nr:fumarylacetoacetase [Pseudomonadota bacterium]